MDAAKRNSFVCLKQITLPASQATPLGNAKANGVVEVQSITQRSGTRPAGEFRGSAQRYCVLPVFTTHISRYP